MENRRYFKSMSGEGLMQLYTNNNTVVKCSFTSAQVVTATAYNKIQSVYYCPRQFTWRLPSKSVILTPLVAAWKSSGQINMLRGGVRSIVTLHTIHTVHTTDKCYLDGSIEQSMRTALLRPAVLSVRRQ
jgi:hypothetical protein